MNSFRIENKNSYSKIVASRDISEGQVIFTEKPFLWFNHNEDVNNEGMCMALTRRLATEEFFPAIKRLKKLGMRDNLFIPELSTDEAESIASIVNNTRLRKSQVRKIFNLVCTYNTHSYFECIGKDRDVFIGERIEIYLMLAFSNHSCAPNSTRNGWTNINEYRSKASGVIAIKDIKKAKKSLGLIYRTCLVNVWRGNLCFMKRLDLIVYVACVDRLLEI